MAKKMKTWQKVGIGALLLGGGYVMFVHDGDNENLDIFNDDKAENDGSIVYASSVSTNNANVTVDDEGKKENQAFEVIIPTSHINGTQQTLTITAPVKLLAGDGTVTNDDIVKHTVFKGFSDDVELEDSNDEDQVLIDYSDSTVNGDEDYIQLSIDQDNNETLTYVLDLNPDAVDVYDFSELEDDGDEYRVDLTSGLATDIVLVFENDQ